MLAVTETGSRYRFNADLSAVKREGHPLRGDGEWVSLVADPKIVLGAPMVLWLEPLSPDADVTVRTTSRVLELWP